MVLVSIYTRFYDLILNVRFAWFFWGGGWFSGVFFFFLFASLNHLIPNIPSFRLMCFTSPSSSYTFF